MPNISLQTNYLPKWNATSRRCCVQNQSRGLLHIKANETTLNVSKQWGIIIMPLDYTDLSWCTLTPVDPRWPQNPLTSTAFFQLSICLRWALLKWSRDGCLVARTNTWLISETLHGTMTRVLKNKRIDWVVWTGPNCIALLRIKIYLAWNCFLDKNRITN